MVKITLHYASEGDIPAVLEVEKAMAKILGKDPKEYNVQVERRCASAHKTPKYLEEIAQTTGADVRGVILGRQPAAPAALDAKCTAPVVFYLIDGKDNPDGIYAGLNVPSGVACMAAPPWPDAMALALLKIAALKEEGLWTPLSGYQEKNAQKVKDADEVYLGLTTEQAAQKFEERKKK